MLSMLPYQTLIVDFDSTDPTHGYVNYLDAVPAKELGLAYVNSQGQAVMKVDSITNFPINTTNPLRSS